METLQAAVAKAEKEAAAQRQRTQQAEAALGRQVGARAEGQCALSCEQGA